MAGTARKNVLGESAETTVKMFPSVDTAEVIIKSECPLPPPPTHTQTSLEWKHPLLADYIHCLREGMSCVSAFVIHGPGWMACSHFS